MTNIDEISRFTQSLQRLAEDHGMKIERRFVGAVSVGDYLVYEKSEWQNDTSVKRTYCRRVCATGGEQGSGPRPSQHWIAVEGDDRILAFGEQDYVSVLAMEEG